MARAAVLGRLTWQPATVAGIRVESSTARTLGLEVDGWTGHVPGQHVDVRLTAADGYTAHRSYSISSAPGPDRLEVTVQAVPDGEVSPYLVEIAEPGDRLEVRGPLGGWFVRHPDDPRPALLVGGGSGIAPLMSMIRARGGLRGTSEPGTAHAGRTRVLYSTRSPADALFSAELTAAAAEDDDDDVSVTHVYTRATPPDWPVAPHRVDADSLLRVAWPRDVDPIAYVCGPTGFVESVADLLVGLGHLPADIRTERFGPTGG